MDDSCVTATSKVDGNESITAGEISSQTIEHVGSSEINVDQAALPAVNGQAVVVNEEPGHNDDHTSSREPLSKASVSNESTPTTNPTQAPSDVTALTSIGSPMDTTTVEKSLLTESNKCDSETSTKDVQGSISIPSINDTSTTKITTSLQSDRVNIGGSAMEEKKLLSSSEASTVTATTASNFSSVTHSASAAMSSTAQVNVAAHNVPKLEPSTLGKIKINPHDFDNFTFQRPALPVIGASGYNSNKVAAEMAKIDSFLASLAKGNPTPSVKVKTETAGVVKPAPVGSALGNIASSYGYSEDESSSSSSGDESEDDHPFNVKPAKMTVDAAVIAMDTQEVERSMKKVAVSSDSSSSSSEDEQGVIDVKRPHFTPQTKSEILLQDLPPVQPIDFVLSEESMLEEIGSVHSIVEQIVVVAHKSKFQVVNIDTIFWLEDRSPLGKVFEVFGPVVSPFYSVRINQNETRVNDVGSAVYFASNDSTVTFYFFPDHMENQKGSDASWLNDEEPPTQFLEYSDDEEEAIAKRGFRKHRSPPSSGQRKPKQLHKERHNRHIGTSNTTSFSQSRNLTCYSNSTNQMDKQPIYSSSIQPLFCSSSTQEYHPAPIYSVPPSTIQNNSGSRFPLPVLNAMPSPLQYSPVHLPRLPTRPPLLSPLPGIPFNYRPPNCFPSSSSGTMLSSSVQLHPPVTLPEM